MDHKPIDPYAKRAISELMIRNNVSVVYYDAVNNKIMFVGAETLSLQKAMSADMCALFKKWSEQDLDR